MIISRHSFKFEYKINDYFLEVLKKHNLFTVRSGLNRRDASSYECRLKKGDVVTIGIGAVQEPFSTISKGCNFYSVGSFSSIASALPIKVKVGRYSSIGQNVTVFGYRHPVEAVTTSSVSFNYFRENVAPYFDLVQKRDGLKIESTPVQCPQPNDKEITIGNDVWIGSNVVLAGGIEISDGSIVAGNSIITKSVPPYSVVAGNPAKLIKQRFPEEVVSGLMDSSWWEYELSDLYRLDFSNPERFVNNFYKNKINIRKRLLKSIDLSKLILS